MEVSGNLGMLSWLVLLYIIRMRGSVPVGVRVGNNKCKSKNENIVGLLMLSVLLNAKLSISSMLFLMDV